MKSYLLKPFVNNLTNKENTYLNEKGSGLSLGEMERIAIARAIYSDSPILLLDECSASLDLETALNIAFKIIKVNKIDEVVVTTAVELSIKTLPKDNKSNT